VEEKEIGAAALRRVVELRSRGATARRKRGEGGEVVREEQGLVGALYRVRREGEGRLRWWGKGRWPAAIKAHGARWGGVSRGKRAVE
jgi:hypothetical protein